MAPERFTSSPDVVYTKLGDEEAVLLDVRTQLYYTINETGVTIWELLAEPHTVDELAEMLAESYEVSREEAHVLADAFVQDLMRDKLVEPVSAAS